MQIKGISDRMTVADGKVEVRGGGGCLTIFGIPFLLMGCAPIAALIFGQFSIDAPFEYVLVGILCLIFIAVGVVLTFARYALEIDGNSRTYRKRFSVLVWTREKGGSLDRFDKVSVSHRVRRRTDDEGGSRTHTDYPIRLEGPAETLDISSPDSLENAQREAEQVAKALRLPLADRTGPVEIVREADRLDESLRQRRRRTGQGSGELPAPPQGMKTRFRIEGAEVVLEIPPAGFSLGALNYLVPALLFPAFVLFVFQGFIRELVREPDSLNIAFAAFFALFGIVLPIYVGVHLFLRAVAEHHAVRVSGDRLHVTTRGLVLSRVAEIPADELEELRITKPKHDDEPAAKAPIVARSDRTTIEFGRHLPPAEREWIKSVLEHALTE